MPKVHFSVTGAPHPVLARSVMPPSARAGGTGICLNQNKGEQRVRRGLDFIPRFALLDLLRSFSIV
jgi:hypothetical protein